MFKELNRKMAFAPTYAIVVLSQRHGVFQLIKHEIYGMSCTVVMCSKCGKIWKMNGYNFPDRGQLDWSILY